MEKPEVYKKIYNLPELFYREEVSKGFLDHYEKKHLFVIVAIYNLQDEILILRDFNKNIGWELPGGYVKNGENLVDAVEEIGFSLNISIDEVRPIAIAKNIFSSGNRSIVHTGVVFTALSRGCAKNDVRNIKCVYTKEIPTNLIFQNSEIIKLVQKKIKEIKTRPPFEEIESAKSNSIFLTAHNRIMKPIFKKSSNKVRNKIFSLIKIQPSTILDVSCGDCTIIHDLYEKFQPKVCIGNDISWKTINMIKGKKSKIIFTNHNILDLPFKTKFDLVIFKNTLHHVDKDDQRRILLKLKSISRQLIIIDVDDPRRSNLLSKIWNGYYVYFLKDQGHNFLNYKEFQTLIYSVFKTATNHIETIRTVKGPYCIANVE